MKEIGFTFICLEVTSLANLRKSLRKKQHTQKESKEISTLDFYL